MCVHFSPTSKLVLVPPEITREVQESDAVNVDEYSEDWSDSDSNDLECDDSSDWK